MKNNAAYKRLAGVIQKTGSKVILKQYKKSLSIEGKRGSGRKKDLPSKAKQEKKLCIFLTQPNMCGRKVVQKVGFC